MIENVMETAIPIHEINKAQTIYLYKYFYGEQDIYEDKQKLTRPEINNKTVENWAYAMIDFKKNLLLSKPIQYTHLNETAEKEISLLNSYVRYCNKTAKDLDLYESDLVCGRGFRYQNKALNEEDSKESPFCLINCDPALTECVYSSSLGNAQLFSFIETPMKYTIKEIDPTTGEEKDIDVPYSEYLIYTKNYAMTYNNKNGYLKFEKVNPLIYNRHLIVESYVNKRRISLIEIGKDLFNDINYLESLDKDDLEEYVNAIMVFTNCEVSEEDLSDIKQLGAVCINSTDQKKASIDLLQTQLNATNTQIYYERLLNALHQILGVPMSSDQGYVSYGDTGAAKYAGMGYTSSSLRAMGDQIMFGKCDNECLKVILEICRNSRDSEIKDLKVSNIDSKFQRDMSDNLLVKTQGLMNLYSCDIPRKYANALVNLFGDPNAVTQEQEKLFGEQKSSQNNQNEKNTNSKDEIVSSDDSRSGSINVTKAQDNELTRIEQTNKQQQ